MGCRGFGHVVENLLSSSVEVSKRIYRKIVHVLYGEVVLRYLKLGNSGDSMSCLREGVVTVLLYEPIQVLLRAVNSLVPIRVCLAGERLLPSFILRASLVKLADAMNEVY